MEQTPCPFCSSDSSRVLAANDCAVAIRDAFPVSPGHTLIIPRSHVASFFALTREEQIAMLDLLAEARRLLLAGHGPDGFTIGINEGVAAGQTVMHLHIHLIPRYTGDLPDPRGGIRWIFPDRAAYWTR